MHGFYLYVHNTRSRTFTEKTFNVIPLLIYGVSVDLMRHMRYIILLFPILLIGCGKLPPVFMPHEEVKNKPTSTAEKSQDINRQVLEVPPELRGKLFVPAPDKIASAPSTVAENKVEQEMNAPVGIVLKEPKGAVAGKHIKLDTRMYKQDAASIFSTTVDAMTALNFPVQSVDSPSGIVTTDWIRQDANTMNAAVGSMISGGPNSIRYRYVVRVLKNERGQTLLQIRTLGQVFVNRHWVNRQLMRKVSEELFLAVEERL